MKTIDVKPTKSWWSGDPRVEKYMPKVRITINKYVQDRAAQTDIYNRAYEAVYDAIKDFDKKQNIKNVLADK